VTWSEIFGVFVVSHLAGDFLFQTGWQAEHKRGGLGPDPVARRALFSHVLTYGLAFVPAFVWLADDVGAAVIGLAALILVPHLIPDDQRLLVRYMTTVKRTAPVREGDLLFVAVDQSFHLIALFLIALLAAAS
jgi:hypothetical protein